MTQIDSRNVTLIGSVTAAVLAGIYVLWGPSERRKPRRKDTCPGLVNIGNTCFLNSLLQALAPCPSVIHWLAGFISKHSSQDCSRFLAYTLLKVLKVLNNDSIEFTEEYCPTDILDALRARRWVITGDEQDSHELFHVLTQTIDEEASRYPSVVSLFDPGTLQDVDGKKFQMSSVARHRNGSLLPILPNKDADHPFRGLLASQLQCKECGHKCPVRYDTFDSLSLSIPSQHVGPLGLVQLLKHYIMSETVQNVECEGCAQRQHRMQGENEIDATPPPKTTFLKKLTIGKLPQCLCIHIQRTSWLNNGLPMKRFEHISFPEMLHMDNFVYHRRHRKPERNLALDLGSGLVGGKKGLNGYNTVNSRKMQTTSPTVSVPYSGPVNLLKALNYHSRATMNGFYVQPQRATGVNGVNNSQVQQLAAKYSHEASQAQCNNSYRLTAATVHLGDVFSGHFITYRRAPSLNGQRFPDRWLYTSDTLVKRANLSEVLGADAYMLFYEKI